MPHVTEDPIVSRQLSEGVSWLEIRRKDFTEIHATAVPAHIEDHSPLEQAKEVYRALERWGSEHDAAIVSERVFCSLEYAAQVAAARTELASARPQAWPVTYLEGGPVVGEGLAGVQLTAVSGAPVEAIQADRGVRGTRVKLDGLDLLFLADFRILSGDRPLDQATFDMFDRASGSLESLGASYSDVVRTWIYLRDILSWYDEFNEGRTRFYRSLVPPDAAHPWPPASTGIEVTPQGGAWGAMDLLAVTGPGRAQVAIEALQSPAQRSPEIYGSCFSRASVLDFGGASTMHVSGTASIDLAGNSLYIDDLKAQTEFTLENVEALLQSKGIEKATFLPSTLFVKPGCDPAEARAVVESWDPMAAHGIWVRADVCRDDLLFEVDGVGALAC